MFTHTRAHTHVISAWQKNTKIQTQFSGMLFLTWDYPPMLSSFYSSYLQQSILLLQFLLPAGPSVSQCAHEAVCPEQGATLWSAEEEVRRGAATVSGSAAGRGAAAEVLHWHRHRVQTGETMMLVRGVHFNWSTFLGIASQIGQKMSNILIFWNLNIRMS